MSDRSRVILIFGIVGLLAGGAGFYFFKIYGPAQDLKNARAGIAAWEVRWQAARDCLLGKSPVSAKTSEALAIREMAPDPWDRGKCTPMVSKLSRGDANDTGIPEIEAAWGELDKAAQKAAMAFADHVGRSTTQVTDPLPAALDVLDGARAKLRASAKLPPTEKAGKALPIAQLVQLADGKEPVTELEIDSIPSADGLILFGKTATHLTQISVAAGATPRIDRIGPASLRAVPDTSWGATASDKLVSVGAFDVEGAHAAPTTFPVTDTSIVMSAIGSPTEGTVVYAKRDELVFVRAKAGAFTAEPAIKISYASVATDLDGRAVVLYATPDTKVQARLIHPGNDEPTIEIPGEANARGCMTKDRAWIAAAGEAVAFGGGRPLFRKPTGERLLQGCTADVALFRARFAPRDLMICADDCRDVTIASGAPEFASTTVVGNKVVAIASHGGVLGVWREGADPTFYALPEAANPVLAQESSAMALTDGKVIDLIARGEKTFMIIRIPAS